MSSNEQKLKRRRSAPRGRQLEPAVLSELRVLLGDEDVDPSLRHRDRLIEHLHALQDTYGYLSMPRLRALATFMNLPIAYSRPRLPLIPDEACHPFHAKAATDSTAKLPPWQAA